jgi:hypothetical protein
MTEQHNRDLFSLEEGDRATIVTTDGDEFSVAVTDYNHMLPDSPETLWEQTTVKLETDDGRTLDATVVDGLGDSHFPSHKPLTEVDAILDEDTGQQIEPIKEHSYGYVSEVRID